MRSCLGSILLVIVIAILAATAFYQWNTNSKIEFSVRNPEDPMITTERYSIENMKQGETPPSGEQQQTPDSSKPEQQDDPYSISDNVMPIHAEPVPKKQPDSSIPVAEPLPEAGQPSAQ